MYFVKGIEIKSIATCFPDEMRDKKDVEESGFTMSLEVTKRVLSKENLIGKDIDIVCFCSSTLEYLSPPVSLLVHHEIQGKQQAICYDINVNSEGMQFYIEQLSKYMTMVSGIKRALIIGTECFSNVLSTNDRLNSICLGDTACAVILEKVNDQSKIIDTEYYVDTSLYHHVNHSSCDMSDFFHAPKEELFYSLRFMPVLFDILVEKIRKMLLNHNLQVSDIKLFCTSQYMKNIGQGMYEDMGVSQEQRIYMGERYDYAGANSPFLCLYEAVKTGRVERGDYVLIWTIGASLQYIMTLIRY